MSWRSSKGKTTLYGVRKREEKEVTGVNDANFMWIILFFLLMIHLLAWKGIFL